MEQKQSTMASQDPEKAGEVGNATGFTMTDQTNYVSKRKVVTVCSMQKLSFSKRRRPAEAMSARSSSHVQQSTL